MSELPRRSSGAVTIREHIAEALIVARPGGLTMAAIAGVVTGPWRSRDVEDQVRAMWERNELARRTDGTFGLTEKVVAGGNLEARVHRGRRQMADAVSRVAAGSRRAGYDTAVRTTRVDPAMLRGGWCPTCRKTVTPRLDGSCPTCSTQTGAAATVPEPKPRRRYRRRPLTKDHPHFGVVCPKCNGPKGKQAHTCRTCSLKRGAVGQRRGPRPSMRKPKCMSEELLQEARRLYAGGKSLREVAAEIHGQTTYKSVASCAEGLYSMFKTRGWPLRPQGAVTAARNHRHGRKARGRTPEQESAYRRWLADQRGWTAIQGPGRPICKGVKQQPPGKGRPCEHHALDDSELCWAHDPRRELERQAQTARMRARAPRQPMLPAGPFVVWLNHLYAELGAWKHVAELLGTGQVYTWHKSRGSGGRVLEQISVRVVQRSAAAAGTTLEAIYADVDVDAEAVAA